MKLKMFMKNLKDKQLFDFSKYSKDSKYYDKANSLIFGKMKDAGLKAEMYTYIRKNVKKKKVLINVLLKIN